MKMLGHNILPIKNYEETDKNKKIINIQNKILKKTLKRKNQIEQTATNG